MLLAISLVVALKPKGAFCPRCERFTVSGVELPDGSVVFSCERPACKFTQKYDAAADAEAEREVDGTGGLRSSE